LLVRLFNMKQKRQACGVEKETQIKELYPHSGDVIGNDEAMDPLITIHCQGGVSGTLDWRFATVYHDYFHRLNVDMWIGERCWHALTPTIPFEQLPKLQSEQ
jgi:hypothetical protein